MIFWTFFCFIMSSIILFFKKYNAIPWIIMTFFLAFRYKFGADYIGYMYLYEDIIQDQAKSDLFHIFIVNLTENLGFNQQFVFATYAILTMIFLYKFGLYFFKNKTYFMLFTLFVFSFLLCFRLQNLIRQYLAISVFLYSLKFIIERKFLSYLLYCIFAFLAHKSAVILFPMYWVLNKKYSMYLIIIPFLLLFLNENFILLITEKIITILNLSSFLNYVDGNHRLGGATSYFGKFTLILYFLPFLLLHNIYDKNDKKENILFNGFFMFLVIKTISIHVDIIGRVGEYFNMFKFIFFIYLFIHIYKHAINKSLFVFILILSLNASFIFLANYNQQYSANRQFSLNLSLFSKNDCIIQIFGNHENVQSWIYEVE